MILESLSPAFLQFKSNYVMNKLSYNMTQLLNELQTFESIVKENGKEGEENVVELKLLLLPTIIGRERRRLEEVGSPRKVQA